jgi:hypothetical protein
MNNQIFLTAGTRARKPIIQTNKLNASDFPSMISVNDTKESTMNYSEILKEKIIDSSKIKFELIDNMYAEFAIFRIKIMYLHLIQKIQIIDTLRILKSTKTNILKNKWNYDNMVITVEHLKRVLFESDKIIQENDIHMLCSYEININQEYLPYAAYAFGITVTIENLFDLTPHPLEITD